MEMRERNIAITDVETTGLRAGYHEIPPESEPHRAINGAKVEYQVLKALLNK